MSTFNIHGNIGGTGNVFGDHGIAINNAKSATDDLVGLLERQKTEPEPDLAALAADLRAALHENPPDAGKIRKAMAHLQAGLGHITAIAGAVTQVAGAVAAIEGLS